MTTETGEGASEGREAKHRGRGERLYLTDKQISIRKVTGNDSNSVRVATGGDGGSISVAALHSPWFHGTVWSVVSEKGDGNGKKLQGKKIKFVEKLFFFFLMLA